LAALSTGPNTNDGARHIAFEYVRPGGRRATFDAHLLHVDCEIVIMSHIAHPSKPLYHAGKSVIESGYDVVWFLFKSQPYDIGRFYRPDGTWTGYYIDILEPVQWQKDDPLSIAPLVDLALDLWLAPDGSYQVLDEDEYAAFVDHGDLTSAQARRARTALNQLITSLGDDSFPPMLVKNFCRNSR
jgi:predicted RNA-binding protein associated with RNAse of E/G family